MPFVADSSGGASASYGGGPQGGTILNPPRPRPTSPSGSAPLQPVIPGSAYSAAQILQQFYGPQLGNYANQATNLTNQYGLGQLGYQQQTGYLNSQYNNSLGQLGLQQQGNAIDQAANSRQMGYYDQLFGLDQGDYTRNVAYQNALKGFLGAGYQVTTGQHQNVLQQLADQASQSRNQASRQTDDALSAATSAGANTSRGHQQANQNIQSDLAYSLEGNRTQQKAENLGYIQATIDRDKASAGIDNTIAGLSSDFARSGLNHAEQEARLKDRQQQLGLTAKGYGLNADQLASQLQNGLFNAGLQQQVNLGQLMDGLASNDINRQQLIIQFMNQIMQFGQLGR